MRVFFKTIVIGFCLACLISAAEAQFAPAAGIPGSTALYKDSAIFVDWASTCNVQRGYMDIAIPDSGYTTVGNDNAAVGKAGLAGVISLGDGGAATLTFTRPIYNGPGFDFAVFENGFYTQSPLAFLELAFVEVSSNGTDFFRFPATSNIQDTAQTPMTGVDCSLVNNLAGKYVAGYGTPFDLEDLKDEAGLDVNNITHVRIIDVVGSVNELYATRDQYGHKINDPYPTAFASGGFDLDAVGVINSRSATAISDLDNAKIDFSIYPNPSRAGYVLLQSDNNLIAQKIRVSDLTGKVLYQTGVSGLNTRISTEGLAAGLYFVTVGSKTARLLVE